MAGNISPITGQEFYSGPWTNIQNVCRVLNIDGGKLSQITMELVNFYQEMVDREIDGQLNELYHVPLRSMNQCQPDGVDKRVFPGNVRRWAIYWTAGLLLQNEFQGLSQNITDQAQAYVDDARRNTYGVIRFNHRLWGQEWKSNLSRTVPPTMQPPDLPEANF